MMTNVQGGCEQQLAVGVLLVAVANKRYIPCPSSSWGQNVFPCCGHSRLWLVLLCCTQATVVVAEHWRGQCCRVFVRCCGSGQLEFLTSTPCFVMLHFYDKWVSTNLMPALAVLAVISWQCVWLLVQLINTSLGQAEPAAAVAVVKMLPG
jgi:hypothetical protein